MKNIRSVCVVGLGYIGLPTSVLFAAHGLAVFGVDVNPDIHESLRRGHAHIVEPGLDELIGRVTQSGRLSTSTTPSAADAFIVAVPTPFADGHKPDLSFVETAVKAIAPVLKHGDLVVLESTSPVGTTERISRWLSDLRPDLRWPHEHGQSADVNISYCPERVLPGRILHELVHNDRVIGGVTRQCAEAAQSLYRAFVRGECLLTDARTAEMCKLTENCFRDVNIAFANELSMLCSSMGVDVWGLIDLANRHPRVNILRPGPGVGGHCIAVDPWFIVADYPEESRLIRTAREVNDSKPLWVHQLVVESVARLRREKGPGDTSGVTIGCFGLAFKPDIDDLRESPSVEVVKLIAESHIGCLKVSEPFVEQLPASLLGIAELVPAVDLIKDADVLVFLVAHSEFKSIRTKVRSHAYVVDACGLLAEVR